MLIDKYLNSPNPDSPTDDAPPPSYETLSRSNASDSNSSSYPRDTKSSPTSSRFPAARVSSPTPAARVSVGGAHAKGKGKAKASSSSSGFSFSFFNSRATRDVKNTVLGLIQDIVRENNASTSEGTPSTESDSAPLLILRSCAEACAKERLTLSSLLQEKYIGGHTPIYWAIINRPRDIIPMITYDDTELIPTPTPDVLTALLYFARPLTQPTTEEIRLACLPNSDQPLFQRLRLIPEFSSISQTDEMILGSTVPSDHVEVENLRGDAGEFAADLEIVQFQRRMRVAKRLDVEFIARARLWRLSFWIVPDGPTNHGGPRPGSWCISLSLLSSSSATYIDSRIIIPEPTPIPTGESQPQDSSPSTLQPERSFISSLASSISSSSNSSNTTGPGPIHLPSDSSSGSSSKPSHSKPAKPRPTITLRLKSDRKLVSEDQKRNAQGMDTQVVVALEDSLMAASLQHAGSSYIASDGILRVRLEARLAKPENECIIC